MPEQDEQKKTSYSLPSLMNATIGRAAEIQTVSAELRREDVRLLTLSGPGGVGKTRLALEVARALLTDFEGRVCFVSLAPLLDPGQVLAALAQALGVASEGQPSGQLSQARVQQVLATQPFLLVLDNFEHLLAAAPLVAELLLACESLKVLVTSRERLHLYGEYEVQVQPLAVGPSDRRRENLGGTVEGEQSAEKRERPAAVQLFLARARAVRPGFEPDEEELSWVTQICGHLDGLPLAIELAAARVKLIRPREMLARLRNRLALLTGGARDLPPRQQSLRNTLDWSYALLTPQEQHFFRRLGVLLGSWSLADAMAVAGEAEEEAMELLTSLVDKSLVRIVEMEGEALFLLLETIREYALDCLERLEEREQVQWQHVEYYTRRAEECAQALHGRDQRRILRQLDTIAPNLWGALRWLIDSNRRAEALRLSAALVDYASKRGAVGDFETVLGRQEMANQEATEQKIWQARVLYGAGLVARTRRQLDGARTWLKQAQELAGQVGDTRTQAMAAGTLALLAVDQGQYQQAHGEAEAGSSVAAGPWTRGMLKMITGIVASKQYDFARAQCSFDSALALLREAGDLHAQAEVHFHLGELLGLHGKLRSAQALYQRALTLLQETEDRWGQVACLNRIGELLRLQGQYHEARQYFERSIALGAELGHPGEQALALLGLGELTQALEMYEETQQTLEMALHLARQAEDRPTISRVSCGLGDLARIREQWEEAASCYAESEQLVQDMDERLIQIEIWLGQGQLASQRTNYEQAETLCKHALELAWQLGARVAFARGVEALAELASKVDKPELAIQLMGAVAALRETLGLPGIGEPDGSGPDVAELASQLWGDEEEQEELPKLSSLAKLVELRRGANRRSRGELVIATLRTAVDPATFAEQWNIGRGLLPERVMSMLMSLRVSEPVIKARVSYPAGLTAREVEVLRLLAEGHSDAVIAQQLVLSPRTINTHLRSVYAKLGVSSRSAATRYALEHGLV